MNFKCFVYSMLIVVTAHWSFASTFANPSKEARHVTIYGSVVSGHKFERKFDDMIFQIAPEGNGFRISVVDPNKSSEDARSDLSWLTFPLHGLTDRDIQASDFRNEDNSAINSGTVNRPQLTRRFVFARDAGAALDKYEQSHGVSGLEGKPDGSGTLTITHLDLANLGKGKEPKIRAMNFRATLTW